MTDKWRPEGWSEIKAKIVWGEVDDRASLFVEAGADAMLEAILSLPHKAWSSSEKGVWIFIPDEVK